MAEDRDTIFLEDLNNEVDSWRTWWSFLLALVGNNDEIDLPNSMII